MKSDFLKQLDHFTGSETWYRHGLSRAVLYTDGAHYVAEEGGAYWLLDEIALAQLMPELQREDYQVWTLAVTGSRATLRCDDGNGRTIHEKEITFTDFPEPGVTLWFACSVILLPREY